MKRAMADPECSGQIMRNLTRGPAWEFRKYIDLHTKALKQVSVDLGLVQANVWGEFDTMGEIQYDNIAAHAEFAARMEVILGPPLSDGLTEQEVCGRAELFAERQGHGSWNSGYEPHRYCTFSAFSSAGYGERGVEFINRWMRPFHQYMRLAYYRPYAPHRDRNHLESQAHLLQLDDRMQAPISPDVLQFFQRVCGMALFSLVVPRFTEVYLAELRAALMAHSGVTPKVDAKTTRFIEITYRTNKFEQHA